MNTTRTVRQALALVSSAVMTLAILGSMNLIATQPAPEAQVARIQPATQVVVITAKRLS